MVCPAQSAVMEQVLEVEEGAALLVVTLLVAEPEVEEGADELDETDDQTWVVLDEDASAPESALLVTSVTNPVNLGL